MGGFQSGTPGEPLDRISTRTLGRLNLREWFSQTARMMLLLGLTFAALLSTTLLAREYQIFLLKSFLVVFLSLLPGWLYLNFIKTKGTGLYDEYVLNLYRLRIDSVANLPKPPPHSSYWSEWESVMESAGQEQVSRNIYLKKFESVYGRSAIPESRRNARIEEDAPATTKNVAEEVKDAFSPVMWATVLLAVGWIVVVQPEFPSFRNATAVCSMVGFFNSASFGVRHDRGIRREGIDQRPCKCGSHFRLPNLAQWLPTRLAMARSPQDHH